MEKLKIRVSTLEEVARRIENNEDVHNYYAIGAYVHLQGHWMTPVTDLNIEKLVNTLIVEIYK